MSSFDPRRVDAWQQYITNVQLRRARTSHWLGHSSIDWPEAAAMSSLQAQASPSSSSEQSHQDASLAHRVYDVNGIDDAGRIASETAQSRVNDGDKKLKKKNGKPTTTSSSAAITRQQQPSSMHEAGKTQQPHGSSGADKSTSTSGGVIDPKKAPPTSSRSASAAERSRAHPKPKGSTVRIEGVHTTRDHVKPVGRRRSSDGVLTD